MIFAWLALILLVASGVCFLIGRGDIGWGLAAFAGAALIAGPLLHLG